MLAGVENKLFDAGGRRVGIEEFSVVGLVGFKVDELKELGEIGLAPNVFRLELGGVGCIVRLDETIGVDGNDVVCVTGGGDRVGVATWKVRK